MDAQELTVEELQQQLQQQKLLCARLEGQLAQAQIQPTISTSTSLLGISHEQVQEDAERKSVSVHSSTNSKRTISECSTDSTSTENMKKRTISECSSSISKTSETGPKTKKKYQRTSPRVNLVCERISVDEFNKRLATLLSKNVMAKQLRGTFPRLHTFRKRYIIPLSKQVSSIKNPLDLNDIDRTAFNMDQFSKDYKSIFIEGCNVLREKRLGDQEIIPDTPERIAYRNFISDCWFILGKYKYIKKSIF